MTELGHASLAVGQTLSVVTFTKIISPYIWGYIADKSGKSASLMLVGALGTLFASLALILARSVIELVVVLFFFSFFWNAVLPLFEATTMRLLAGSSGSADGYGRIRVWGSVSFILVASVCGFVFEVTSARWVPWIIALFSIGIGVSVISILPHATSPHTLTKSQVLPQKGHIKYVIGWLVVTLFFLHGSTSAYYAFFDLYLLKHHYPSYASGLLISIGVVVEVLFFIKASYFVKRWSAQLLLVMAIAFTSLRWFITAFFVDSLAFLLVAQILHVFTYAVAHVATMTLLDARLTHEYRNRGQALYSSLSFGLGGAVSSVVFGYLWMNGEGAVLTFVVAGFMAALALLTMCMMSRYSREKSERCIVDSVSE